MYQNEIWINYSCLENPMDGGAWWAAVHGVARSQTRLSDFTFTFHFHALEKEMATHSSVLAWRILGTGEPGGLPSMGSHRVGHDWSDLVAAAAAAAAVASDCLKGLKLMDFHLFSPNYTFSLWFSLIFKFCKFIKLPTAPEPLHMAVSLAHNVFYSITRM